MVIALFTFNIIVLLALTGFIGYTIGKGNIVIMQKVTPEQQARLDKIEKERLNAIEEVNKELRELQNGGMM